MVGLAFTGNRSEEGDTVLWIAYRMSACQMILRPNVKMLSEFSSIYIINCGMRARARQHGIMFFSLGHFCRPYLKWQMAVARVEDNMHVHDA